MAPLIGIRVVSTAANVPGPVAAAMLRDMGATVTKIEPLSGDPLAAGAPGWYGDLCRRMDVQRIDLKSAEGTARLSGFLEDADLLITATRPASLQRLGLSWEALHVRHPRLSHVAILGYPPPREEDAGHDLTYQADAGLVTPPTLPRTLIADLSGAQRAVIAALGLLLARASGAEGGYGEVALSEAASLFAEPLRHGLTDPTGWLGGGVAAYGIYAAREGWVAVAALEPQFSAALARELGVSVDDREALRSAFATRSADEWHRWGNERGLPVAAVR